MSNPEAASPAAPPAAAPKTLVIQLGGRRQSVDYQPGETILETVRRAGLKAPFACQQGNCGTCMAHLTEGEVSMRQNNALDEDDVREGWILTCQSVPTSAEVVVDYDR